MLRAPALALALALAGLAGALAGCAMPRGSDIAATPSDGSSGEAVVARPAQGPHGEWAPDAWNDPAFKKQFVYGLLPNAEIEPRVSPEDMLVLEQIRPLMGTDLPKAKALLEKEVIKPDAGPILFFQLGSIHFQMEKFAEALECYRKAVEAYPTFRRAYRNMGLIYAHDGRADEAITAFTKMIELGGGDAYSYGYLGSCYASKEDYQAAEVAYRNALLLQPQNTEWRRKLAACVLKQGKYEDTVALLHVLIEKYPDNVDFWMIQAEAFLGMKQPLKAAQDLEAVDRLGKSTTDSLFKLGNIYFAEELMDPAAHAYCRAFDVKPDQPIDRSLQAADLLMKRGAIAQARLVSTHLHEVAEARLSDADRRKLLKLEARLSMAQGGGTEETAVILEEVIKIDPLDGEALILLGQHYGRMNQPNKAMLYYERAGNIPEFAADASFLEARVLVGMRRYTDAIPLLRRSQELRPREDVARYLEQVDRAAKNRL
jgi:tetratricopeptide (TPR) repeat protein